MEIRNKQNNFINVLADSNTVGLTVVIFLNITGLVLYVEKKNSQRGKHVWEKKVKTSQVFEQ